MAKNPVFPLYYNDILGSCKTWSDEEFGAYMRLLIEQWDKGGLPKDYQRLTRIATSLDTNWPMIKAKFQEDGDLLKNENLEAIRNKLLKHKEKQRENVLKRYQTPTNSTAKIVPLETEKENEIENSKVELVRGSVFFNAEDLVMGNQIEYERICMNSRKDPIQAKSSLRKYHLFLEEKEQYPKTKKAIFAGFEKWLLNEKTQSNGTHQQAPPGNNGLGTSEARTNKAKNW